MERDIFDYSKLKGKIVEVLGNQSNYAKALGLSETSITNKLNNAVYFTQGEIMASAEILHIDLRDISTYFFTLKVEKTKQD